MVPAKEPEEQAGPKRQERGRRRIESILDAAEQVVAEVGYDAATTNLIAARAGISPGSLYQYFANKPAIVEALSRRYLAHLAQTGGDRFCAGLADLPMPEIVDGVVDPIVAFNLAHPAARSLLAGACVSAELAAATAALHAAICDEVEALIGQFAPDRSTGEVHLAATVSFQIFTAVMPTIATATHDERPRVIHELKSALAGYWNGIRLDRGNRLDHGRADRDDDQLPPRLVPTRY